MTNEQAIAHFKEQLEIFGGEHHEAMKVAIEALDLIQRQQEWIESKINANFSLSVIKSAKAEAIKDFAERLKEKAFHDMNDGEAIVCCCDIDNLVKEMVGGSDDR